MFHIIQEYLPFFTSQIVYRCCFCTNIADKPSLENDIGLLPYLRWLLAGDKYDNTLQLQYL